VSPLPREGQLVAVTIKAHPPGNQLLDLQRAFIHQDLHGFPAAQSIAGAQRILEVKSHFVIFTQSCRDSALSVLRTGFVKFAFGEGQYFAGGSELKRGPSARNSSAHNQEIDLKFLPSRHILLIIAFT